MKPLIPGERGRIKRSRASSAPTYVWPCGQGGFPRVPADSQRGKARARRTEALASAPGKGNLELAVFTMMKLSFLPPLCVGHGERPRGRGGGRKGRWADLTRPWQPAWDWTRGQRAEDEQRMLPPEPLCLRVQGDGRSDAWMARPPPSCWLNSHWLQRESLEMQWLETRGHSNCPGSAEIR